jgi:iron complex outermembrane recepter protein
VYELGYRAQASPKLTYSIAAYHAVYDHLRTQEIAPSRTSLFFANGMEGTITGGEIGAAYQVLPRWRLAGGFTALDENLRLKPGSEDVGAPLGQEGRDPSQTWRLSSSLDLPHNGDLEISLRHVGELAAPNVPAYLAVDLRYGWRPTRNWEVSVTGRNLSGGGHAEFNDAATRTHFERTVFFKLTRQF